MGTNDYLQTLRELLEESNRIYQERGFARRVGYGQYPALVIIDLGYAWTRPAETFACDNMDEILDGVKQLLDLARPLGIPVVYTTTAYAVTKGPNTDMGLWHYKLPIEELTLDSSGIEIDERIAPLAGEQLIVKKRSSAFHGTYLAGFLRAAGVDTVIITGVAMGGCVRHTVEDALAEGFRPIVVRECVGDHVPGAVEWNLFDVDGRFGDVEALEEVSRYLERLEVGSQAEASQV